MFEIFWIFFGFFFLEFFWRNFFGGIFVRNFFGGNLLGGMFWDEFFCRNLLPFYNRRGNFRIFGVSGDIWHRTGSQIHPNMFAFMYFSWALWLKKSCFKTPKLQNFPLYLMGNAQEVVVYQVTNLSKTWLVLYPLARIWWKI